jgi:hypothetical protein
MKLLPERSEIKKILRANCVKLEYDCADCADDLFKSAIDLDIDTLAEEWRIEIVARIHSKEHRDYIKFSDFIVERIGGK